MSIITANLLEASSLMSMRSLRGVTGNDSSGAAGKPFSFDTKALNRVSNKGRPRRTCFSSGSSEKALAMNFLKERLPSAVNFCLSIAISGRDAAIARKTP